jgi:carbon storage regulator CsrA
LGVLLNQSNYPYQGGYVLFNTRKEGESIQISDDIVIRFNDIHQKQIKVAIEAPIDVPVVRAELLGELEYE